MTYSKTANRRISDSVKFTEGVQQTINRNKVKGFPRLGQDQWIVKGTVVNSPIDPDDFGQINVYKNGEPQGLPYKTVWLDWVHGGESISVDVRVIAEYVRDEDIWTIIAADCEPEALGAPPGDGDSVEASTTQTRGQAPLSYRVNRVTVVANNNDVVTLPSAFVQGDDCFIQNADVAETLQMFPAGASDTINGGSPGASETLAAGLSVHYFLVRNGHWVS